MGRYPKIEFSGTQNQSEKRYLNKDFLPFFPIIKVSQHFQRTLLWITIIKIIVAKIWGKKIQLAMKPFTSWVFLNPNTRISSTLSIITSTILLSPLVRLVVKWLRMISREISSSVLLKTKTRTAKSFVMSFKHLINVCRSRCGASMPALVLYSTMSVLFLPFSCN